MEALITLPGTGREIALNALTGLLRVTAVRWPFDSSITEEWPPTMVEGFRVWWDDAQPVLYLNTRGNAQPQIGDEVRLWYVKAHTIQNLDSGDATTMTSDHESVLCIGAAGHCCSFRSVGATEAVLMSGIASLKNYTEMSRIFLSEFRARLAVLARQGQSLGEEIGGGGWRMDKWDV